MGPIWSWDLAEQKLWILLKQERKAQLEQIEREKKECKETFSRPECEKECPQYDEFDDTCDQV